jgi:hypothetical protein
MPSNVVFGWHTVDRGALSDGSMFTVFGAFCGCCNSGIISDKNNKHPYIFAISSISSARWLGLGGVCLPYDRDYFIKQHNRNMWWERSEIEADRRHNWLSVLMRVQLYLIFIFEDGVYIPLQDTAINNIAVSESECQMTSSTRWVRGLRSTNENC